MTHIITNEELYAYSLGWEDCLKECLRYGPLTVKSKAVGEVSGEDTTVNHHRPDVEQLSQDTPHQQEHSKRNTKKSKSRVSSKE